MAAPAKVAVEVAKHEAESAQLFQPLRVGRVQLQHRVALAPLTRTRAHDDHTPSALAEEYYEQRASVPGTLLISEATSISPRATGWANAPGIWTPSHVEGWRRIAARVHAHGSSLFVQLWALGRAADAGALAREFPEFDVVSSSAKPIDAAHPTPRALTVDEIGTYVREYASAAANAIEAGADGVEIHSANGYLPDQFLQDVVNQRTDGYGGSVENRARFLLEIVEAVSARVGQDRVALRLSPWSKFQSMGEADPRPLFSYLVGQLRDRFPSLAYIHVLEPRGDLTVTDFSTVDHLDVDFLRQLWQRGNPDRVFLSAGAHTRQSAIEKAKNPATVAVFGRQFISNPDLPLRLKYGAPLQAYDRSTFYVPGPNNAEGYTTYKALDEAVDLVAGKA